MKIKSSLPHRQLRNVIESRLTEHEGSLPHRQLRKCVRVGSSTNLCSLPHRQLRKSQQCVPSHCLSSLPHRQLRKYGSLLKRVFGKYVPTKRGNTQFPKKQDKINQKLAVKKSERQSVRKIIKNEVLELC